MAYKEKFYQMQNCLQMMDFECPTCGFDFLTNGKKGDLHCPACGSDKLEGKGVMVVGRTNCVHHGGTDSHEYAPRE